MTEQTSEFDVRNLVRPSRRDKMRRRLPDMESDVGHPPRSTIRSAEPTQTSAPVQTAESSNLPRLTRAQKVVLAVSMLGIAAAGATGYYMGYNRVTPAEIHDALNNARPGIEQPADANRVHTENPIPFIVTPTPESTPTDSSVVTSETEMEEKQDDAKSIDFSQIPPQAKENLRKTVKVVQEAFGSLPADIVNQQLNRVRSFLASAAENVSALFTPSETQYESSSKPESLVAPVQKSLAEHIVNDGTYTIGDIDLSRTLAFSSQTLPLNDTIVSTVRTEWEDMTPPPDKVLVAKLDNGGYFLFGHDWSIHDTQGNKVALFFEKLREKIAGTFSQPEGLAQINFNRQQIVGDVLDIENPETGKAEKFRVMEAELIMDDSQTEQELQEFIQQDGTDRILALTCSGSAVKAQEFLKEQFEGNQPQDVVNRLKILNDPQADFKALFDANTYLSEKLPSALKEKFWWMYMSGDGTGVYYPPLSEKSEQKQKEYGYDPLSQGKYKFILERIPQATRP